MPTTYETRAREEAGPRRLHRAVRGAWVAGVAAGLADHLGIDARPLRWLFVLTTLFGGGVGLAVYLVLWALTPQDPDDAAAPAPTPPGARFGGTALPDAVARVRAALDDEATSVLAVGVVLVVGAVTILLGGSFSNVGLVVPLALVAVGVVLTWAQLDRAQRARWAGTRSSGLWRAVAGAAIALLGLLVLGSQGRGLAGLTDAAFSGLLVLVGVAVIAAPWALRGWDELQREQAERVRATERADIAAHLHDSVLQTLALIQRKADDPAQVARLARKQERDLRAWLYGGGVDEQSTLASEAAAVVHQAEDTHGVPIDLVVTGDAPLDDDSRAFVRALGEAVSNAVRHGAPPVSVYVEIGRTEVEAFVRDHGPGFDLDAIPADRAGVRHSVIGRLERRGGRARFRRLDEGTEVSLQLPLTRTDVPASATPSAAPPVQETA